MTATGSCHRDSSISKPGPRPRCGAHFPGAAEPGLCPGNERGIVRGLQRALHGCPCARPQALGSQSDDRGQPEREAMSASPRAPRGPCPSRGCTLPWACTPAYPPGPGSPKLSKAPGSARPGASSDRGLDSVFVQREPLPLACLCLSCTPVMIVIDSGSRRFLNKDGFPPCGGSRCQPWAFRRQARSTPPRQVPSARASAQCRSPPPASAEAGSPCGPQGQRPGRSPCGPQGQQ